MNKYDELKNEIKEEFGDEDTWGEKMQLTNREVLTILCEFGNLCRTVKRIDIGNDAAEFLIDRLPKTSTEA